MVTKKNAKNAKVKRSSAEKRVITSKKRNLINQSFKSKVKTVAKKFEASLKTKDSALISESLNNLYSLIDKGVKRKIFKLGKGARMKSRATAKVA
ncbi:30S ribosomal protein S20 [Chlamydiifrater volucris]|uniref:30S ribosomal protein S20 n=1 Tax=Chlamydiifrater volucris TaxID=2681470 RepID=UPI001BCC8B4D|nr:30S ribosomal protein S20 [Chlamydiifrater volucris]